MTDTAIVPPTTNSDPVKGPDGKWYKFPAGTDKAKQDAYFKSPKFASRQKTISTASVTKPITEKHMEDPVDPGKMQSNMQGQAKGQFEIATNTLPDIGGIVGGMLGGTKASGVGIATAAGGQAAGEAAKQFLQRLVLDKGPKSINEQSVGMIRAAVEGAGMQATGEVIGSAFIKLMAKIPHAVIKDGIPLLPGDLKDSKMGRYVEDLLSNLIPSAKTMAEFKTTQKAAIEKAGLKVAQAFSKFKGTSEQMGELVQQSLDAADKSAYKALRQQVKSLPPAQAKVLINEYRQTFKKGLLSQITNLRGGEFVSGLIAAKGTAIEDVRTLVDVLEKQKPSSINAARTQILKDVLTKTMRSATDPVEKGAAELEKFKGTDFIKNLSEIGEDKLKALYGERYASIEKFGNLIKNVGGQAGNGAGKFINLAFILGPWRGALTLAGGAKLATEASVMNTAAKFITNPKAVEAYSGYVRAVALNAPKAINAARKVLTDELDKAHQDTMIEQEHLKKIEQDSKEEELKK